MKGFLLTCFLAIISLTALGEEQPKWVPIVGFKSQGVKAFVDKNSIQKLKGETGEEYTRGIILMVSEKPIIMVVDEEVVSSKSKATVYIISCETTLLAPVVEMYFDHSFPTNDSKPVAFMEYNPRTVVPKEASKTSLMFSTLCPSYM